MSSDFPRLRVYVAGRFSDKEVMHKRIVELQSLDFDITHDWTQVEGEDNRNYACKQK